MRIAAISDVHGNLAALDAVLADIEQQHVDVTVNLGDLLSGGLEPAPTADRLLEVDLPTVRGNHERQLLTLPREQMGASDRLAHDGISARHRDYLASLPPTLRVADGVLAFHGSPADDLVYLLETVEETRVRPATADEVARRLGEHADRERLLLCGHTHLQRTVRLPGGALVANPGSVGWPAYRDDFPHPHVIEAGTPHARYLVADLAGESWSVQMRAVAYPWDRAALIADANGRPDVAHALRTGKVREVDRPRS